MFEESIYSINNSFYDSFCTHDGLILRYGFWPRRDAFKTGVMVLLGGRSEYTEKYFETIDDLCSRGYDVFSFDWRGQGLSSRIIPDSTKGHVQTFEHYIRDLDDFLKAVVYPHSDSRVYILAHSMGGHITLRFLENYSHQVKKAVLLAPMINISTFPLPQIAIYNFSKNMVRLGHAHRIVIGSGIDTSILHDFSRNRLTSDMKRYKRNLQYVKYDQRLLIKGVTFGWFKAAFDSISLMEQKDFGRHIRIPVLICQAGQDRVVCNKSLNRFVRKLPNHVLVTIKEAKHEILQERDNLRNRFWCEFDNFMDEKINS
ncbi:MAG: alpha/beta hydrolase [Desulfobacteraceae bacterium]|nr:alpha/beta hydrolase [Desulfobacteraceae bacterium]